jgi:hypothetical protein
MFGLRKNLRSGAIRTFLVGPRSFHPGVHRSTHAVLTSRVPVVAQAAVPHRLGRVHAAMGSSEKGPGRAPERASRCACSPYRASRYSACYEVRHRKLYLFYRLERLPNHFFRLERVLNERDCEIH